MMAEAYRAPGLCNYYCSQECVIGKGRTPRVESKELVQIVVETLNGLRRLNQYRDRLLEIAEDGEVSRDEYEDFGEIRDELDRLQLAVSTLQLWIEERLAQGELEEAASEDGSLNQG